MLPRRTYHALLFLMVFGLAVPVHAQLAGVSGTPDPAGDIVGINGSPAAIAKSLAHGFPLWYQDAADTKIAPCLDFSPLIDEPANVTDQGEVLTLRAVNAFCFTEEPINPNQPISFNGGTFPENFPGEFPYWGLSAEVVPDFIPAPDPDEPGVPEPLVLVEISLSGSFVNEVAGDGEQIMIVDTFIRLRNLPFAGPYTLTTPFAQYSFSITETDARISHGIASNVAGDYLAVLGVAPNADALRRVINLATVSGDSLDAFFTWGPGEVAEYHLDFQGAFPLAVGGPPPTPGVDPLNLDRIFSPVANRAGTPIAEAEQRYAAIGQQEAAIEPAPENFVAPAGQNIFDAAVTPVQQFIILDPPDPDPVTGVGGADLGNGPGVAITIDRFSLQGKLFNTNANIEPVAENDAGFAAGGISSMIVLPGGATLDVTANDTDDPSALNAHPIHPRAVGAINWPDDPAAVIGQPVGFDAFPTDDLGNMLLASKVTTEKGGTVRRVIDRASGKTQFLYTPPTSGVGGQTVVGDDRFLYVVQDTGGLMSSVATVTVTIEAVNMTAQYRTKNGRWTISGNSSETTNNTIEIYNGPTIGAGATAIARATVADNGTWKFEGKLPVSPDGTVSCRTSNGVSILNVPIDIK